jgi:hypothetical protein
MQPSAVGPDQPAGHTGPPLPPVHALFNQRFPGDDALLKLARLRFEQAGMAAELYADTPDQLEHVLRFVAPHPYLPTVHLSREINLLRDHDREVVEEFAARFAGRVAGLVVHDKAEMGTQTASLVAALGQLNTRLRGRPDAPRVFLEYAAGLDPAWFAEVAAAIADLEQVSCCIDIGHVGIRQACANFASGHPGLDLRALTPSDERLPDLVADVQQAVGAALRDVLELIGSLGALGKHLHFHLHDGHPLIGGLSDHFSFLTRLAIPFSYEGRRSLSMLYGPRGLATIMSAAAGACGLDAVSFTLEIHQVDGRLPLGDAAEIFRHWRNTTNAERMNRWLAVLAENVMLVEASLR